MVESDLTRAIPLDREGGNQALLLLSVRLRDLVSIINNILKQQTRAVETRNEKKIVRIEISKLEELKNALKRARQRKQKEEIRELLTITKKIKNKLLSTNIQKIQSQIAMIEISIEVSTIVNNVATTIRNIDNRKRRELIVIIRDKNQKSIIIKRLLEAILEILRSIELR